MRRAVVLPLTVAAVVAASGLAGPTARAFASGPPVLRAFVHLPATDDLPSMGNLDLEQLGRSATDLRHALADRKKTFVVVDTADQADVVVEVRDRSVSVPRFAITPSQPIDQPGAPPFNEPVRIAHVRIRVTYSGRMTDFTNKNAPSEAHGGWQSAAEDLVKQVEKWVREPVKPPRPAR